MQSKMGKSRVLILSVILLLLIGSTGWSKQKKVCVSPGTAGKFLQKKSSPLKLQSTVSIRPVQISTSGEVMIMQADPELLILSNAFDLHGMAIHFQPAIRGRYTYSIDHAGFDGSVSQNLDLNDDDSHEFVFKYFAFPYGKKNYDRCFINSNGSITFEEPDPDPPSAENLAKQIPRIAGFFTDLDPESTGAILVHETADKLIVSWLKVPEFFNQNIFDYGQNTFQIVLNRDGRIDLVYTSDITATQAFVGILSGVDRAPLRFTDFSRRPDLDRPFLSHVENFHDYESIDLENLMKTFYEAQPDRFDFVTLISNFDLTPVPGAQAFSINVQNNVHGIGNPSGNKSPIFRDNETFGSSRRLQNITFLGNIHQYPSNPYERIPELNASLLDILAHEVGHRWLSYIEIPRDGKNSGKLLGRDKSHWSFFFDTSGSFLEGNEISQKTFSSFATGTPFRRYSDLDLYLMGFLSADEVSDSFYVDGAHDFSPNFVFLPESSPEAGVRFHGQAVAVRIEDVIEANGARKPGENASQKNFRHAFLLVVKNESPATPEEIAAVDLLRTEWESLFSQITRGKGNINTAAIKQ